MLNPEGKGQFGKTVRRWENNFIMKCIHMAEALVGSITKFCSMKVCYFLIR